MKQYVLPLLAAGWLSVDAGVAQTNGTVNFANNNSSLLTNGLTGMPATVTDGIQAALYWAQAGSNVFSQIGAATNVGVPLPGTFAGGTRVAPSTPGGVTAQFQVRAWGGGYDTYEHAVAAGNAVLGQSSILQVLTGNPAGGPPTPPASLIAAGLHGFTVTGPNPCSNSSPAILVTKLCPATPVAPGATLVFTGSVTNTGNVTLTNVTVVNNQPVINTPVLGPITLAPGAGTNFTGSYTVGTNCGPYVDTLTARGSSVCGGNVTNSAMATCPSGGAPGLMVTKQCPALPVPPGGTLTYTGTVTNTGNITLTNVTVVNDQPSSNTPVLGPITLAPGAFVNFTNSYTVPTNCGPFSDTLTTRGTSICGVSVTNSATAICAGGGAPAISVGKSCPAAPVPPGGILVFSGAVTNTGNVTLTNVTVINNQPSSNTLVLGPITLGPGAVFNFTNSYPVGTNCGPYGDTLVASGMTACGVIVSNSATAVCSGSNLPAIFVTKQCPAQPVGSGATLVFTGTITNTGNITLTNVNVVNSQPVPGTHLLGPLTLAPGQGTSFLSSYTVSGCGPFADTLTASGTSLCGVTVTNSATATCPGTNLPAITVVEQCPGAPVVPGGTLVFTGAVTNTGNVTLTNVTVVNNHPSNNAPVLGPITLGPGAVTNFVGSYTATNCGPFTNILTARGSSVCGGNVTNVASVTCPGGGTPAILVTKQCPGAPVAPGGMLVFTGTVTNTGNMTLTNVTVVNNQPSNNTPVFGPITLAPGAGTNFSGSYTVSACGPYNDMLTARGTSACGTSVTNVASASCPSAASPAISVAKVCPASPVPPGGTLVFTGTLTNTGNVTLTNVTVVNNQPSNNTPVLGPITLAPGAITNFTGSYIVQGCGPYTDTVTAQGTTVCGIIVTNAATAICPGSNLPGIAVGKQCPAGPVGSGGILVFTGSLTNTGNVSLTNVTVVNNQPTNNTLLLGPITLAPGAITNFIGSYTVQGCGPFSDTLTAQGMSPCGVTVTNMATAVCPGTNLPGIAVGKQCPPAPVGSGGTLTFTGAVTNSGNVTLTNVTVVNNQPTNNTLVLGAITLAPGAIITFTNSYTVPPSCGLITDTLTVVGASVCGGSVTNSAVASCSVTNVTAIGVTKICPAFPVPPGGILNFTGTVTNTGTITLTNVVVMNNKPVPNTMVFGPVTLFPGVGVSFSGSYNVPVCTCGPFSDTLTAKGTSLCGVSVTNSATAICPGNTNAVPGDLNGDGIVDQNELNIVLSNYWAHSPWVYMTNFAQVCNGRFQFVLTNANGWNFTVLVSSNLVDWTNLPDPAFPVYQFVDPAAASNAPQRFYQLRYP
jgi:uncharacterized repeat protein (TIGR01451 family)